MTLRTAFWMGEPGEGFQGESVLEQNFEYFKVFLEIGWGLT